MLLPGAQRQHLDFVLHAVAARLNVNLEQDVDFCPGLSKFSLKMPKSQDAQGPAKCGIWGENPGLCFRVELSGE